MRWMKIDPPTPQHQRLIEVFTGEWRSEERVASCPGGQLDEVRHGRLVARAALGGRFVISDYVQEREEVPVFAGHGVYGWDGERYTMQWFDTETAAGGEPAPGVWDGELLVFTRPGTGPRERYEYEFRAPGAYRLRVLVGDESAGWVPVLAGLFRRFASSRSSGALSRWNESAA